MKISKKLAGRRLPEKTRQKMSATHKQMPGPTTGMHLSTKGIPRSEETKRKISEALKGKPSYIRTKPNPMKGVPRTEETKKKISLSRKGKPNLRARGFKHSEKSKRNMSEGKKRSWARKKGIL